MYFSSLKRQEATGRNYVTFFAMLAFIIAWVVLLLYYDPRELVERLGVQNGYVVTFVLAVIGAFTSVTTVSIYPAIVTFTSGGLHFLIIGIVAGIGMTIGDSLFFLFGQKGRYLLSENSRSKLDQVQAWLEDRPAWLIPFVVYVWVSFSPFPNNLVTGSLALSGYAFKKIFPVILLGNLTLSLLVVFLTAQGIEIFSK